MGSPSAHWSGLPVACIIAAEDLDMSAKKSKRPKLPPKRWNDPKPASKSDLSPAQIDRGRLEFRAMLQAQGLNVSDEQADELYEIS